MAEPLHHLAFPRPRLLGGGGDRLPDLGWVFSHIYTFWANSWQPDLSKTQNQPKLVFTRALRQAQGQHVNSRSNRLFIGLAYQGKDIVFRFIIEYSSLRDIGP